MGLLIAGVLLWSMMHLMKSVTPGLRVSIQRAIGEGPHKGLVALALLGAVGAQHPKNLSMIHRHGAAMPIWC